MAGKPGFSFGFAKKAEPKKYVAALSLKKVDDREEIKGLNEEGQVVLEKPKEGQGPPVIACKNLLDGSNAPKKLTANLNGQKPKVLDKPLEECAGGIVSNIAKLSDDDAEAMRELLKDAAREDGEDVPAAAACPILMKAGSKAVRSGNAPEASREMFENQPVETFGEAMLRGMGYDPNVHKAKPIIRDTLRDNLLGLGAKALLPGEKAHIKNKKKGARPAGAAGVAAKSSVAAAASEDPEPTAEEGASAASSAPAQKKQRVDAEDASAKPVEVVADVDVWASRGLVVRVISKEAQLKDFFGAEAVVLEVDEAQMCCRIKARPHGGDKSQQLKGVRLKDIETRVSGQCKNVRIVRGSQKGLVAKLVKRDTTRGVAVLNMEGAESEMSLDDVCQFME